MPPSLRSVIGTTGVSVWMVLTLVACASSSPGVSALARIHDGDEREAVVKSLSDAPYHGTCNTSYASPGRFTETDAFIYGTRQQPYIILVTSFTDAAGTYRVSHFGTVDLDALPGGYKDCLPAWVLYR